MKNTISFLLLLICCSNALQAQLYPFRTYSIEEGLSESVVNDIIQDREGYIWLATGYGLNRFDGLQMDNFFEDRGLNNSKVHALFEDTSGRIWIGTEYGVNYWEQDSIYTPVALGALANQRVISIFEDSKGDIWFGTDGAGAWVMNFESELIQYGTSQGFRNNRIRDFAESEDGSIWFATRGGLTQLKDGNIRTFTTADGLPENRIRELKFDQDGALWIATREGVVKYDQNTFEVYDQKQGLNNNRVQTLTFDANNRLWVGTEGGVSVLDNGTFKNFTTQNGLSNNIIYSSTLDREGNLWFGTFGGGANLFLGDYFENFTSLEGLSNDVVTSIVEGDDGNIWIATYGGGLNRYDGNEFQNISLNEGLLDDKVFSVDKDSKGRIWIGMRNGLAYLENGSLNIVPADEFPYRKIREVYEDSNGIYWISTDGEGLIRWDGETFNQITIEDGLADNAVLSAVEGPDGSIWIATKGGVSRYYLGEVENFTIQEGLPNNGVMMIIRDRNDTIWASTFGGIAWFDGLRFQSITTADGLPNRVCYFIHQSTDGQFWIGTNNGITRFDASKYFSDIQSEKEQAFQLITSDQGLVSDEMNLGAVYEDSEGHLWFGSVEGVSHFLKRNYLGNPVPPKVKVDRVIASGRIFNKSQNFELSYDQNYVEINFSGINFTAPNQVVYEYKMNGVDPDWQRTMNRNVKYPSLPSGEYTFMIHARNTNGTWSRDFTEIDFKVSTPYWMQWWFLLLIVLVLSGIIFLFYNYYRARKLIDIERIRVRIASDLHDDVGASLTEVALQSDFLQASKIDPEFKKSLEQIGKQCRRIVTSLDDIVWSIDARNDTLGDLTDRMQDYILNVLEPKNFEVVYDFEDLKMENKLAVPLKENLYLIFKEAVNNISKYSNGDKVNISMNTANGLFTFKVHDNGTTGKGTKKTGHGLRNMEMRAKRIGAHIDVATENGFTITITGKLNAN
ncbi:sensor histidine kinase [Balneola vulgaris]|uniref:sensor histidine kinase n=1 Tax=Balneola vulgaris TaxID=287535 RepID=UPI0012FA890C|nr:sensor histidine kinase [Balneola vulgaris]